MCVISEEICAQCFAIPVEHVGGGGNLVQEHIIRGREHRCDPRFMSSGIYGFMAHQYTFYIADLVAFPRCHLPNIDPYIPGLSLCSHMVHPLTLFLFLFALFVTNPVS